MPLAHWNNLTIFFAHVPKTGGSSVEDYLIRRFGRLSLIDANKRRGVRGTGLITPTSHLAAVDLAELVPPDLTYSFAVVREPLERLMSEFRYQSKVSRMSRLGFSTWLRVMLRAARTEPRVYENHIRPQTDLIPESTEIFRLEDGFEPLVARLDEVTGTTAPGISVNHLNPRPREEIRLSREDVGMIAEFYAKDYDQFGYVTPGSSNLPSDGRAGLRDALARPLAMALMAKQRRDWVR